MVRVIPCQPAEDCAAPPDRVGVVLGGTYRLLGLLGRGAMGSVYRAQHLRLGREVAVKFLAHHLASDPQVVARFRSEAEIISVLHHPNIVEVMDFDSTEAGEPFLVFELLKGELLDTRMQRGQRFSPEQAIRVAAQIASALAAAHAAGVVHRDIKPGNIFLVDVEGSDFVKLLDFGISKSNLSRRGLTGTFQIMGTPSYMPPEQAAGRTAHVDHRGDQFSLAIIVYEMLTGQAPFRGESVAELLRNIVTSAPRPPSDFVPALPRALDDVLLRGLSKEPDARYPDVLAFANALASAMEGHDVSALPPWSGDAPPRRSLPPTVDMSAEDAPFSDVRPSLDTAPGVGPAMSAALERARGEWLLGNVTLALFHLHSVLERALSASSPALDAALEDAATLLEAIVRARAGSLGARIEAVTAPHPNASLSPTQAFLVSRAEVGMSLSDLADTAPFCRAETLHRIALLLHDGLLVVGEPAERESVTPRSARPSSTPRKS